MYVVFKENISVSIVKMSIPALSPELQQIAWKELNEDSTKIQEYLQEIREWIATQDHLNVRPEDRWLLQFLRGCKYDLVKTKKKIETFHTIRTLAPEFFGNRDPFRPEIQELLELGVCIPLPKTLHKQPIFLLHYKDVNTKTIHMFDIIKVIIMSLDVLLNEHDNCLIFGQKSIEDVGDLTLTHILQVTPSYAKKIVACFQDAYPIRLKAGYFINVPPFFKYFFALLKSLLGKKLRNRIKLQSATEMDELYNCIPRSVLPIEYGGEDGSIKDMAAVWKKKVESYRGWFLDDEKYRSDESKRAKPSSWSLWGTLFGNEVAY